jgi:L-ascorbate metabolism protein UlaG (beta-lactamase superfamily)
MHLICLFSRLSEQLRSDLCGSVSVFRIVSTSLFTVCTPPKFIRPLTTMVLDPCHEGWGMSATYADLTLDWLGYATSRIADGERVVYIDPGRYGVLDEYDARDGDLVLVTHDDHYDPDGIERVAASDAVVVIFEGISSEEIGRETRPIADLDHEIRRVGIGDRFEISGISIEAISAYNEFGGLHSRDDGTPYHPEGEGVGYRITLDTISVFYPGDSDVIPEYEGLTADVFLAPIDDAFTMSPDAILDLAERMETELVVPVHYDTFEALEANAAEFAAEARARGLRVEVLSSEQ